MRATDFIEFITELPCLPEDTQTQLKQIFSAILYPDLIA